MSGSIEQIDKQLEAYYKSLGAKYEGLFATYCEENGIDNDSLKDELEEQAEDNILVDFDEDFPFTKPPKNEVARSKKILNIIKKCYKNTGLTFDVAMPEFNQELFDVSENELNEVKQLYETQCPVLWNSGMDQDQTFLRILAIGRKHKFDYLQHLVDDYFIGRVKNMEKAYHEKDWGNENQHMRKIANLKKMKNSKYKPFEVAVGAVKSFGARCCPKLLFTNMIEINDSLEISIKYIVACATWMNGLIKVNNSICPFQVDLCIGYGKPSKKETILSVHNQDEDDDDDDDDIIDDAKDNNKKKKDEQKTDFYDCIGDIQKKLQKNKLTFELSQNDADSEQEVLSRTFGSVFNEFRNKLEKSYATYPQNRRFVTFVDRRGGKRPKPSCKLFDDEKYDQDKDDIWIYEPPQNCRNIPRDVVPEWYISASRTCLLPNMNYDAKQAESAPDLNANSNKGGVENTKEKLLNANICSSSHCKGALLTLSFIAKEKDSIKSYLYWNGQITRFSPEDIRDVFPKLFNMKWNDGKKIPKGSKSLNQQFIEKTDEIDRLIYTLNTKMSDKYFSSFRQSYI